MHLHDMGQNLNRFRKRVHLRASTVLTLLILVGVALGSVYTLKQYQVQSLTDPMGAAHVFEDQKPVEVSGFINPSGHVFADPVTAVVTIWVDTTAVDPDKVTFNSIALEPYETMSELERSVEIFADSARITYTAQIRCLSDECLVLDGSPLVLQMEDMYVRYELLELNELDEPNAAYVRGGWNVVGIAGRIDPEIFDPLNDGSRVLDPALFDANSTPPDPVFAISLKYQRMLVLLGAVMVGLALIALVNPHIRIWPEREDPAAFVAKQQKAARLAHLQRTSPEIVGVILKRLAGNVKISDALLYRLRNELCSAGLDDLALRVERLDFGPKSTATAQYELIADIHDALNESEAHYG